MGETINPFGKKIIKVETELCGRKLSLEVGRVGFRTTASVIVRYGETVILGSAMLSKYPINDHDGMPLTIDYEERFYAAGKISGSRYMKREGKASDEAVLIDRLIDRPIRPLFPKGYRHEIQGVVTVLSMDPNFRPDAIALIAMSAAFMLTGAPFDGPVAAVRVGIKDGKPQAFMSLEELAESDLDLVVAGTDHAVTMVEAGANEVSEATIVEAIQYAHDVMQPAIELQKELVKKVGVTPQVYELSLPDTDIRQRVETWLDGKLGVGLRLPYPERNDITANLKDAMRLHFSEEIGAEAFSANWPVYEEAFNLAIHKDVRKGIVEDGVRPDGRKLTEVRPLSSEVGILPRAHGSSLFTRGMTQAMNIVTLATLDFAQMVDSMEKNGERRYMHHYNAPGYTTGEIRRLGSPGRREIGHSYLAERALLPVLPDQSDFPYAIRSVTEIMSQNGSTSQAAVCSSCLALMDAGVPLKRPVSGVAMGLMMDGDKPYILTDIADAEDFAGDMDFKVAGTTKGITALQMDMKVHGLPVAVLKDAIHQGNVGRAIILEHMLTTLDAPRKDLSPYAPRIESMHINPDKIRDIIGKGGETINRIIDETGAQIDVEQDGTVMLASPNKESIEKAREWILGLTEEPEVGKVYTDRPVVSVLEFGAFVEIMPGKDGLVHVSEMAEGRVNKPSDVVKEGDRVDVKLISIDDRGRLQLSMRAAARDLNKKK